MNETWKDIPGYEGKYQASDLGNIRSLNYSLTGKVKLLLLNKTHAGYMNVRFCKKGFITTFSAHYIIMLTFIGERPNGLHINHKNGIKTDNRLSNLEYCTMSENIRHSIDVLGKHKLGGNRKSVLQLDLSGNELCKYASITEAARSLLLCDSHICNVCRGTRKTAGGFIWKYSK